MPRYEDGKFQQNATQNVFLLAMKSILDCKMIPKRILQHITRIQSSRRMFKNDSQPNQPKRRTHNIPHIKQQRNNNFRTNHFTKQIRM